MPEADPRVQAPFGAPHEAAPDPGRPVPAGRGGASFAWDLLYGAVFVLGSPYFLWRRLAQGKDREGGSEKRGHLQQRTESRRRIWIHAVSVGEARLAQTLVQGLKHEVPDLEVVISTTTPTGQAVARQWHGAKDVFYYPLDFSRTVRRCLDRVRPALIVLIELEVWPNLTAEAAARGVPVVVVNGRISARAARRYRLAGALLAPSFRRVRRWLMQSEEYARRALALGVEPSRVEVAGNMKYDAVETRRPSESEISAARAALDLGPDDRALIGGSTHPGEDEALLDAYLALRPKFPTLRLALVPRHPQRLEAVKSAIESRGLTCLKRSALKLVRSAECGVRSTDSGPGLPNSELRTWDSPLPHRAPDSGLRIPSEPPVVLVDTMGELGMLYRAAEIAFVGGSLIPHGGQNVMEPAGLALPVVYGPHMHNFAEAVEILRGCDGAVQIARADELRAALERLLADAPVARAMGARAREAFLKRQGATARCVAYLKSLLELP
jgi:3-deoxy-D-manno-octulosonic-acid transferase